MGFGIEKCHIKFSQGGFNMKKTKKITRMSALALASMLCFSACGNQSAQESTDKKESTGIASQVEKTSEVAEALPYWELLDQVSDTSELPDWDGDTLEITIWYAAGTAGVEGEIEETDVVLKEFERVTGVRINAEESFDNGGNNIDAKLPMVVASNDFPTIVYGYDIGQQLSELYENGYLADLTEYYENGDLDQLTKWFPLEEMETTVYSSCRNADGEYYLIPGGAGDASGLINQWSKVGYYPEEVFDQEYYSVYGVRPQSSTGRNSNHAIWVRDDILEVLKPDALTVSEIQQIYVEKGTFTEEQIYSVDINSSEEFFDFLRDIKELLASGEYKGLDGKPMEVTYGPNTESDNWYAMCYWPSLIDGVNSDYFSLVNKAAKDESEVMQWAFTHDYFVEYMKEYNKLVREDVVAKDSFLDNSATYSEKLNNLHYAVTYSEKMTNIVETAGSEIGYSPIWVNTPYNTEIGGTYAISNYNIAFGIFKDALSEDEMDQLIHAINYLNSVVGTKNSFWGPKSAGLFTEDESGNRKYVDTEVYNCMILNEDNGANKKYGLTNSKVGQRAFSNMPLSIISSVLTPSYLAASDMERNANNALTYYIPGVLPGQSYQENVTYLDVDHKVYGPLAKQIQGLADFWTARNGFENQMKKVLVAESDSDFDKQFENLKVYAKENGLTDETLKEYNALYVEANRESLKAAGIID